MPDLQIHLRRRSRLAFGARPQDRGAKFCPAAVHKIVLLAASDLRIEQG
jgi:hypothetical protein